MKDEGRRPNPTREKEQRAKRGRLVGLPSFVIIRPSAFSLSVSTGAGPSQPGAPARGGLAVRRAAHHVTSLARRAVTDLAPSGERLAAVAEAVAEEVLQIGDGIDLLD